MSIPSVISRMESELEELTGRVERARAFVLTETFKHLPEDERGLFMTQIAAMGSYHTALSARLKLVKSRNNIKDS